MKRGWLFVAMVALALAVLGRPAAVGAVEPFDGKGAGAIFSAVDDAGVATTVYIGASRGRGSSSASVEIIRGPVCDKESGTCLPSTLEASGSIGDAAFRIPGNLGSATLEAVIPVCDAVSGACFDVEVHLSWAADGDAFDDSTACAARTVRYATAVGTVSAAGENYTPAPSFEGQLVKSRSTGDCGGK